MYVCAEHCTLILKNVNQLVTSEFLNTSHFVDGDISVDVHQGKGRETRIGHSCSESRLNPLQGTECSLRATGGPGIFLSNFQGGAFEILDLFSKQISDLLKKLWTFQYAAGFRGPDILKGIAT